jgi:hypothetical protein
MNQKTKEAFRQFIRNERWGTCGACPRDSEGNVYPEFCIHTKRYDHKLTFGELTLLARREYENDLVEAKDKPITSHSSLTGGRSEASEVGGSCWPNG